MGDLYLLSTPIGNRKDISLRALAIFKELNYLLCEDTRKTKQLLDFYEIKPLPRLVSFFEQNEQMRLPEVLGWLKMRNKVGLVTNAGTPSVSDPGFKLVRECVKNDIQVVPVPGPSALLAALVISGLPTDKFTFLGFLPKKQGRKEKLLKEAKYTVIAFESPFRLLKTLEVLQKIRPESQVVICREMTKKFEETLRGRATELLLKLKDKKIKGEIVLMF
ncbi:MAG: 16S rRNA (cytidine(1402)-2'-O)-methyltransferase [Patescibacteria group bacterium]|nr:16S rRNA (cytidine(1402)-2'-O)-methyltransferase [Patescibacteria group bacterium]